MTKEMEIQYLQVLVMPNGEIMCAGKALCWNDKDVEKFLVKADRIKEANGKE